MTMHQTRHIGASIDQVRDFRTLQEVQRRGQWRAFSSVTGYDKSSRPAADYHSLLLTLRNKLGNTRATCRGTVDRSPASPAAHKRMTGKCMLDVFGGTGLLAKATNHLDLRSYVLDTKFGPRYDVTQHLVLTRIRLHVSVGKCVAGMIPPPSHHTSCSPKVIPASASCGTCRKSRLLRRSIVRPGPWRIFLRVWITVQKADFLSIWKRGQQGFAPCCTKMCWDRWTLQCDWTKTRSSKGSASRSKFSCEHDHPHPHRVSRACHGFHPNARRFQRTHLLSGIGSSLNASKDIDMGLY